MSRFVLVTTLLMFSAVTGCTIVSGALDLSPTPGIAIKPASTVTIKPSLTANAILPTSAATSMPQWTPMPLMRLSDTVRAILDAPQNFSGREIEVVGYFRGWNLLGEVSSGPPVTRSDWVIADNSGAIYVTGLAPQGLNPSARGDIWNVIRLRAVVVYAPLGSVYLKAIRVDVVSPSPLLLSTATSTAASQHKVLEKWQIELVFSGGLAGLRRTIELSDTGRLTITDQKASKQVVAQVPAAELAEIVSFLPAVERFQPAGRLPACRDCFQYELGASMDGQRFSIQLNDSVLVESGLAPLINALVRLQERALSGQLKP